MQRILLFSCTLTLLASMHLQAQFCDPGSAYTELDANNITAGLHVTGDLWWDGIGTGKYIAPKAPVPEIEVSALFFGGLWMRGQDVAGNQKVAVSQYPTGNQSDYYPGPLNNEGEIRTEDCPKWDKFFPILLTQVEAHAADAADGVIDDPIPAVFGWPGRNNTFMNQYHGFDLPVDQNLAPFKDLNGNGQYEPDQGEYPVMKGSQSIWWVFNDAGNLHFQSGADMLGVEVQVMAYAEASDNVSINNTTFYEFKVINQSVEDIDAFYMGLFIDPQLGCYTDDYVGYDTTRHMAYVYNADAVDGEENFSCPQGVNTYGDRIPMIGIAPIHASFDYVTDASFLVKNIDPVGTPPPFEPPIFQREAYNILGGLNPDGTAITYGGIGQNLNSTDTVQYMFTGNPDDSTGWSMCTTDINNADPRMYLNTGNVLIEAGGGFIEITYAVIFVEDVAHPCPSLDALQDAYDEVVSDLPMTTSATDTELATALQVWPNPSSGIYSMSVGSTAATRYQVTDLHGRVHASGSMKTTEQLDLSTAPEGVYLLTIYDKNGIRIATQKLVKTKY